ncbi:MAG: ComEC/Rec2 family competence protein [Reichenbachiella sp.]
MYRWTPFPFLRITFSLICGILASRAFAYFFPLLISQNLAVIIIINLLIFFSVVFFRRKVAFNYSGHILLLIIFNFGLISLDLHSTLIEKELLNQKISNVSAYTALVNAYPSQRKGNCVYEVISKEAIADSSSFSIATKIQIYSKKNNDETCTYAYGDKLLIKGNPFLIQPPKNPHEFNYAAYMADQNIFFQQFPDTSSIIKIDSNLGNPIFTKIYRLRKEFESVISTRIAGFKEQAVAKALLLGIKDQLDPQLKQAFSAAGAMHVLAVSGLHVGVIYMILIWMFKSIRNSIFQTYLLPILILVFLWFYAVLTGFSPSIFRAVTMFSVIIIGKILQRNSNIYNSLAVSAFILLLINPFHLFAVGFQLSYLAVIGIVYFFDKFYLLIQPTTIIMDEIWKLTCVSIAAQIATAPISIYYFHQFPTYFMVSNLLVIPLSFIIMVIGVGLLALSQFAIAAFVGQVLEVILKLLNFSVESIFHVKWSVHDWLYLSLGQTISIYTALILISFFLYSKQIIWFWGTCAVCFLISLEGTLSIINQSFKKEVIFYSTRKNQAIDLIHGLNSQLYSLDSISDLSLIKYQVEPYRISSHQSPISNIDLVKSENQLISDFAAITVYDQIKFLHIFKAPSTNKIKFKTDFFIMSNNSFNSLSDIKEIVTFDHLIIDPSNKYWIAEKIKSEVKKTGKKVTLLKDGALIYRYSKL